MNIYPENNNLETTESAPPEKRETKINSGSHWLTWAKEIWWPWQTIICLVLLILTYAPTRLIDVFPALPLFQYLLSVLIIGFYSGLIINKYRYPNAIFLAAIISFLTKNFGYFHGSKEFLVSFEFFGIPSIVILTIITAIRYKPETTKGNKYLEWLNLSLFLIQNFLVLLVAYNFFIVQNFFWLVDYIIPTLLGAVLISFVNLFLSKFTKYENSFIPLSFLTIATAIVLFFLLILAGMGG